MSSFKIALCILLVMNLQLVLILPSFADKNATAPLIPIEILFGDTTPDYQNPELSPDGIFISYLAPYEGVTNIWVRSIGKNDDHPVTKYTDRSVSSYNYRWTYLDNKIILEWSDDAGNTRIYLVDTDGNSTCLTPQITEGDFPLYTSCVGLSPNLPDKVLIFMNLSEPRLFDYYHLNLKTGVVELVLKAEKSRVMMFADNDLNPRGYWDMNFEDHTRKLFIRSGNGEFKHVATWTFDDYYSIELGFDKSGRYLYVLDNRNRNTNTLIKLDTYDSSFEIIAEDEDYDIIDPYYGKHKFNPINCNPQAVLVNRERFEWLVIDDSIKQEIEKLRSAHYGDLKIHSQTVDDKKWIVSYEPDNGPISYYLYSREDVKLDFLFYDRDELLNQPFVKMKPVSYKASDGIEIHGYLSLPNDGVGWDSPGSMVLYVHGGPPVRENWGFNPKIQWLANRGYAVLIVNFRGSDGYGREFRELIYGEYGGKVHQDLVDAVSWAVEEGIADPDKIVIYGRSFGGFLVLSGITFTPDLYAAAIEESGVISLIQIIESQTPDGRSFVHKAIGYMPYYEDGERAGKFKDEKDCTPEELKQVEYFKSIEPIFHLGDIKSPVFITAGGRDIGLPIENARKLVDDLKALGVDVEYAFYEDEGHKYRKPENRLDYYRKLEIFLTRILNRK